MIARTALFASPLVLLVAVCGPALAQDDAKKDEQPASQPAKKDEQPAAKPTKPDLKPGLYAKLETTKGTLLAQLEFEKTPRTVANFVGLMEGKIPYKRKGQQVTGKPYFDGLTFHRIIAGFMIQGGCPDGTGTGSPGYSFQDETRKDLTHKGAGILSMANSDRGKRPWSNTGRTNGSQFFITLGPTPHLNGLHTVFGNLVAGMDVLKAIGAVRTGARDKPVTPVLIKTATVIRVGEAAEAFDAKKVWDSVGLKDVPEVQGDADPSKVPAEGQPERKEALFKLIGIQYKGATRAGPGVRYTKEEAVELAKRMVAHARLSDSVFDDLVNKWSDLPLQLYKLQKAREDPSFGPAFVLTKGQVSDPVVTPYGILIFEAQN